MTEEEERSAEGGTAVDGERDEDAGDGDVDGTEVDGADVRPSTGAADSEVGGPATGPPGDRAGRSTESNEAVSGSDSSPLGRLAEEVRDRRSHVSEHSTDPFDPVDVDEIREAELWEGLTEDESLDAGGDRGPLTGGTVARVEDEPATDAPEYVVDKSEFCQNCEHFAEPPTVACEHEEATILEVADSQHFRVRGCPFVGEENVVGDVAEFFDVGEVAREER